MKRKQVKEEFLKKIDEFIEKTEKINELMTIEELECFLTEINGGYQVSIYTDKDKNCTDKDKNKILQKNEILKIKIDDKNRTDLTSINFKVCYEGETKKINKYNSFDNRYDCCVFYLEKDCTIKDVLYKILEGYKYINYFTEKRVKFYDETINTLFVRSIKKLAIDKKKFEAKD